MKNNTDHFAMMILGFLAGAAIAGFFCFDAMEKRLKDNIVKACGTCHERSKMCGEFTCTKRGCE